MQEAVDHILDAKSLHVPVDLEWDDLPSFHRAVLAAHQAQCEYAIFLHELWSAVWKPALDACDIGISSLGRIADTPEWWDLELDTHALWLNGVLGHVLDIADTKFALSPGVVVDNERALLWLSLHEDKFDPITGLDLGADWPSEDVDEDGFPHTRKELAPIADDGSVDLDALRKAATDALAAVGSWLRD